MLSPLGSLFLIVLLYLTEVNTTTMKCANLQTGFGANKALEPLQHFVHWSQCRLQSLCVLKLFDLVEIETAFDEKIVFRLGVDVSFFGFL